MKKKKRKTRDAGLDHCAPEELTTDLIELLAGKSSAVLVKKLSRNDRQWAIYSDEKGDYLSHQGGPIFPEEVRRNFFPPLTQDKKRPHNHKTEISILWPVVGKIYKSRVIWYSDKGNGENHLTRNPMSQFENLAPASYLIMFKPRESGGHYRAVTVDSTNDVLIEYIRDVFKISDDFACSIYAPNTLDFSPALTAFQEALQTLLTYLLQGEAAFYKYARSLKCRPAEEISHAALAGWMQDTKQTLNPFQLDNPGDIFYDLTRNREFALYRQEESLVYGAKLAATLIGQGHPGSNQQIVSNLIEHFHEFYKICLSAKQARSSRAGGSFESHVKTALTVANISHTAQYVFDGSKPDFVLPSGEIYSDPSRKAAMALILTLKTTLKERWRQVVGESKGCPIYLATLDENVNTKTLQKLESAGIVLVVPERFKKDNKFTEYVEQANVISFRTFFDHLRDGHQHLWIESGLPAFNHGS